IFLPESLIRLPGVPDGRREERTHIALRERSKRALEVGPFLVVLRAERDARPVVGLLPKAATSCMVSMDATRARRRQGAVSRTHRTRQPLHPEHVLGSRPC